MTLGPGAVGAARAGSVALAYFLAGWAGLQAPYSGAHITLIWLPTGIAVAALWRWGGLALPGIGAGAFLANLTVGSDAWLAGGIAVGNTLGPWIAVRLLRWQGFEPHFERRRDAGLFVIAAAIGMLWPAAGGVLSLVLAGITPAAGVAGAFVTWWMGDYVGVLLAAPLLLTLDRAGLARLWRSPGELPVWALSAASVIWLTFAADFGAIGHVLPLAFLPVPFVVWAALSFGVTGASAAALAFAVAAALATAQGHGALVVPDAHLGLLLVWVYMACLVFTALGVTALHSERLAVERRLRDSETRARALIECAPDAIIVIDERGLIQQCNPAAEQFFGYRADELRGRNVKLLIPSPERERHDGYIARYLRNGVPHVIGAGRDVVAQRRDGSAVPVQLRVGEQLLADGSRRFIGFVNDLSERVREQAELERHRHHLERLVAERTAEAMRLAQVKSDFLANMSHEIRTPLHAIVGLTHLLQGGRPTPEQAEKLGRIAVSAEHLLSIVSDVLDLSKIEAGKLEIERRGFRLAQVCDTVDQMIRPAAEAKLLTLVLECPHRVLAMELLGDAQRIAQVLVNLAGNAVKFTERGVVTLRAVVEHEGEDDIDLRFEVVDTGIGIDAQALPRLFSEFEQIDNSATRRHGGTGLGLAISRRLLELMGSRIAVESQRGVGSTFRFVLRLGKRRGAAPPGEPGLPADEASGLIAARHRGARVLVAEDEPVNQLIATELLAASGLVADVAGDGEEAVAMAAAAPYDLILMDVQMPGLNGIEATRRLRRAGVATPVVALTANAFSENRQQCLEAGMDDFLAKPVAPAALYAALLRHLHAPTLR